MSKALYDLVPEKMRTHRVNYAVIPSYILDNIKYPLFDWQRNALLNFLDFQSIKKIEAPLEPTHLMFNMATGTGKTLMMAALILYYYKQGYRHFLFFVNQNNIVGKTEENLTNPQHGKYLFTNPVVIDNEQVRIKQVNKFSDYPDGVEILFTSIHKLHNAVYQVKENQIFLEDLQRRDIVMLGDEAHHLNADTKKGVQEINFRNLDLKENTSQDDVERSWENTVIQRLLNRDLEKQETVNRNVLLEFTATIPRDTAVIQKYHDKIIYKFDLKAFLNAGFTKEINLVSSSFDKKQRILQALLFNWYRKEISLKYHIPNFKPVILFRSKYVDSTLGENSQEDYKLFQEIINNLSIEDFDFLNNIKVEATNEVYKRGQSRIVDIKNYIDTTETVTFQSIIEYFKYAFQERHCIITNSKNGTKTLEKTDEETERLLNNLEDKNNHITAIFTVKRLTEGWDVLNLFDIVRMYEGRDEAKTKSGARKAGQSTVSEVQLIGRGVRYYPFEYRDAIKNKRKFDRDLNHEMRVLEELYFHSDKDERYLSELKNELKRQELLPEKDKIQVTIGLKKAFDVEMPNTPFRDVQLWVNEREENPNKRKKTLADIRVNFNFKVALGDFYLKERTLDLETNATDKVRYEQHEQTKQIIAVTIADLKPNYRHVMLKAMNVKAQRASSIYRFCNLKKVLDVTSIENLFLPEFLGLFEIEIVAPSGTTLRDIPNKELLKIFIQFFEKVENEILAFHHLYIGSEFKVEKFKNFFSQSKTITVKKDPVNKALAQELKDKNWYVMTDFHGTSEEIALIKYLKDTIGNFNKKYDEVYLLRNEAVYKIYDFEQGRGFMPDFILFLNDKKEGLRYQVFIEPKGQQFIGDDGSFDTGKEAWKETFLAAITEKYGKDAFAAEHSNYRLIGLPLYNKNESIIKFNDAVKAYLAVDFG